MRAEGGEENIWCEREVGIDGCKRLCSEFHFCFSSPDINFIIAKMIILMWHVACV